MTRDTFISIFQAWMRARNLTLTNDGLALSEEGERIVLMDLCAAVADADRFNNRPTKKITPEKLSAALAAGAK